MMLYAALKKLWLGQLPLPEAFWRYLITYDLILNLTATFAALGLFLVEAPAVLATIVHFSPLPYSLLAATGTWRSASRYGRNPNHASAAKVVVLLWVALLVLI